MIRLLPVITLLCAGSVRAQTVTPWSHHLPGEHEARLLRAADPATREAAAERLARVGDAHRARTALVDSLAVERIPRVRAAIARSLAWRAHPDMLEGLVRVFDVARDVDARPIAMAIGAVGTPGALRVLTEGLAREDLAAAAREALERAGLAAAPHLARSLREDPTSVAAVELLGRARDVESVPILVRLSRSELPAIRRASIEALGTIADARGRMAVVTATGDSDPSVVVTAWRALRGVGTADDAARVETELQSGEASQRRALLETLLALSPERGTAMLVSWVTGGDPTLVRIAGDLALEQPQPAMVSILYGLFQEGSREQEAAAALAEVEGGAGIVVLLREIAHESAQRELAVALRRWGDRLSRSTQRAGHRALAQAHAQAEGSASLRLLVLRALAQGEVAGVVGETLQAADAATRAIGAQAAWLLGDRELVEPLQRALAQEQDPDAWRRMALALASMGAAIDEATLMAALSDAKRAPEAALAAAHQDWQGPSGRRLRRRLRELLRGNDARARACAAWSLAGDPTAWRALLARVERDDAMEVRRAAARALARMAPRAGRDELRRHARASTDDQVRHWLERAASGIASPAATGRQVLRFGVVTSSGSVGVIVDVVLHDGQWLRMRTLPSGEIFFADLPESSADVRVRVTR